MQNNPPAGRPLPWHPLEYNEHTSQRIIQALAIEFVRFGEIIDTYRHQQLPFGLEHMETRDVQTIQLGIRPGPMLSREQLQRMALLEESELV